MTMNASQIKNDVKKALEEDIGAGDVSAALLPKHQNAIAEIISREPMLVCGIPWVEEVFAQVNPSICLQWSVREGDWLPSATSLCIIKGVSADILTAERTALNFMQTLSATATQTYHYVQALNGTTTKLLDTRKTIPGLRAAQKYAVACAGGINHRMGLYDAYLIKENHIKACGSIAHAIELARKNRPELTIEIEVETINEFKEALLSKPDRILLDNFDLSMLIEAVDINQPFGCQLEASGGIHLSNIKAIAQTGVNFISVGAITKSISAIDLSLLIREIQ